MIKGTEIMKTKIETRINIRNGSLLLSSYLKCFPEERGLLLNSTAKEMFLLIDGKKSILDIAELISNKYNICQEVALSDIKHLFKDLLERGLVEITIKES